MTFLVWLEMMSGVVCGVVIKEEMDEKVDEEEKDARDLESLNFTYKMLRYWISMDGTLATYGENYANPNIRFRRIMFLEEEHTQHTSVLQGYIDEILGKCTGEGGKKRQKLK